VHNIFFKSLKSLTGSFLLVSFLFLGACSGSSSPGSGPGSPSDNPDQTQTDPGTSGGDGDGSFTPPIAQPSPPIIDVSGQLLGGQLDVTGQVKREKEDEEVAGIIVTVTNISRGTKEQVTVDASGEFSITIAVNEGDLIIVRAEDPDTGQESNVVEAIVPEENKVNGQPDPIPFEDAANFDFDNDGVNDAEDDCPGDPLGQIDTDGDGICNSTDADDDNDGVPDTSDAFPLDASESVDSDGDGIGDNGDNCDNTPSSDLTDTDNDGEGDICDTDDDNDGVADASDCAPLDSANKTNVTQFIDADGDGVRENSTANTACTDGSAQTGFTLNQNGPDNCPTAANADQADSDGDGEGDVCDSGDLIVPILNPATGEVFFLFL